MRNSGLRTEVSHLQSWLAEAQQSRDALNNQLCQLRTELQTQNLNLEAAERLVAEVQERLDERTEDLTRFQQAHDGVNVQLAHLRTELQTQGLNLEAANRHLAETQEKLDQRSEEFRRVQQTRDSLEGQLNQARTELQTQGLNLEAANRQITLMQQELSKCSEGALHTQNQLRSAQEQIGTLLQQQGELPSRVAYLEGLLDEKEKNFSSTLADCQQCLADKNELQRQFDQNLILLQQTHEHLNKCHQQKQELEAQLLCFSTELDEIRANAGKGIAQCITALKQQISAALSRSKSGV